MHRIDAVMMRNIRGRPKLPEHPGGTPRVDGMGKTLGAKDLWLLGVLLNYADGVGVISDLSRSMLTKLTGMNARQLERRLEKLEGLGLLFGVTNWVRSSAVTNGMHAIIHLNLDHPVFRHWKQLVAQVFYVADQVRSSASSTPLIDSLPLAPFSLAKLSKLQDILLPESQSDELVAPAAPDGELPDQEPQEPQQPQNDPDNLKQTKPVEGSLERKKLERERFQAELKSIKVTLDTAKADQGWQESLKLYFSDFATPRCLKWFQARVTLYAALILEAEWGEKLAEPDEDTTSLDAQVLIWIQRDFSKPGENEGDLGTLHRYIHGLARIYADELRRLLEWTMSCNARLEKALDRSALKITVTRHYPKTPRDLSSCSIFFWRTRLEVNSPEPVRSMVMYDDHPTFLPFLPSLRWLQSPLPQSRAAVPHSEQHPASPE